MDTQTSELPLQSTRGLIGLLVHDLISPITALLGGLDCLSAETYDQELLDCMRTSGDTLRVLLDFLRLFSMQPDDLECALCFRQVERYLQCKHRATFQYTPDHPNTDVRLPALLTFVLLLSKTSAGMTGLSCVIDQRVWTIEVVASSVNIVGRAETNTLIASLERLLHAQLKESGLFFSVASGKQNCFYIKTAK